jgi:ATP phosphoribosyltransferase regulatory subunit
MTTTREPVQIGAELYGHPGLEADIEVLRLMAAALARAGVGPVHVDIGHPGIYRAVTEALRLEPDDAEALFGAVQQKDAASVKAMGGVIGEQAAAALARLTRLNGDATVLDEARRTLPGLPAVARALDDLERLAREVAAPSVSGSLDLAELGGYNYENGIVFAAFVPRSPDALARGGRYDGVGKAFGRARAATGFTMDLREIASLVPPAPAPGAILAPCVVDGALDAEVARLRAAGEVVIADLPGHGAARAELGCDRALEQRDGRWAVVKRKD